MARLTKEHEIRKREFVETARRLFNSKGYEHTTVDDIVKVMGVAKGLFYYYFESKDALLDTIIDKLVEEIRAAVVDTISRDELSAIGKLELLLTVSAEIKLRSIALVDYFHEPRNKHLHLLLEQRVMKFLVPAAESIIEQGVREGVFDTKTPHYASVAYLGAANAIGHLGIEGLSEKEVLEMVRAFQVLTEKMLGARPGMLDVYQNLTKKGMAKLSKARRNRSRRSGR